MKKLHILLFLALIINWSCSNEFDLVEDKQEIPVVYALLDYEAEYQFVRLERAFASPTISGVEIAKNPDSIYYKNAVVKLIRTSNGVKKEFTLEEVDGNQVGYPREDGIFAKSPNKLYRISSADMLLTPGDIVELNITVDEGAPIKSTTNIISKTISSNPSINGKLSFSNVAKDILKWNSLDATGGTVHSLELSMRYTEVSGTDVQNKSLVWTIAKNVDKETYTLAPNEFFTFLSSNLTKDDKLKRYLDGIDYFIYSGDKNLSNFLLVSAANTGITGSGEIPTYTNLSRGLGLFGSKAKTALIGLDLSNNSRDILKESELTKGLNFQ